MSGQDRIAELPGHFRHQILPAEIAELGRRARETDMVLVLQSDDALDLLRGEPCETDQRLRLFRQFLVNEARAGCCGQRPPSPASKHKPLALIKGRSQRPQVQRTGTFSVEPDVTGRPPVSGQYSKERPLEPTNTGLILKAPILKDQATTMRAACATPCGQTSSSALSARPALGLVRRADERLRGPGTQSGCATKPAGGAAAAMLSSVPSKRRPGRDIRGRTARGCAGRRLRRATPGSRQGSSLRRSPARKRRRTLERPRSRAASRCPGPRYWQRTAGFAAAPAPAALLAASICSCRASTSRWRQSNSSRRDCTEIIRCNCSAR